MKLRSLIGILCGTALFAVPASAQDGGALFRTYCAICHDGSNPQAPTRDVLGRMSPEQILDALEKGAMKAQAAERSRVQRHALAEYLSGKPLGTAPAVIPASAFCTDTRFQGSLAGHMWNGWGAGL